MQFEPELSEILTKEELEDQFLRLKEVFNCTIGEFRYRPNIWLLTDNTKERYDIFDSYISFEIIDMSKIHEITNELKQVKNRLENMYPVEVFLNGGPVDNLHEDDILSLPDENTSRLSIFIRSKKFKKHKND